MKSVNIVLFVLCVVCASLCTVPASDAGPLRRIASAPFRLARNVRANRMERWGGELPRQRVFRATVGYGWGGSCASGSCN